MNRDSKDNKSWKSSKASQKLQTTCQGKKKILISHMRNEKVEFEASRRGIANTFVKFHSDLYS